jgi:hypothetical protein
LIQWLRNPHPIQPTILCLHLASLTPLKSIFNLFW